MLCENCGKNTATTLVRTVVNGVVKEQRLCSKCAKGYTGLPHSGLANMLASMLGDITDTRFIGEEAKCPICSASFSDIAKTGRVGCAECYKTFKNELLPYLKRVHGSTKHVGKVPNSAPLSVVPETENLEALRSQLSRLVSEERYEEAAVVRDKIRNLEGENNG